MSLLGIDIGTSSCKGVVFSADGRELASESYYYQPENPSPSIVEMNASIFRDAVFDVIKRLSVRVTNDPIEALAISSHGETTIPVDASGKATGRAIMNSDNRAVDESLWWEKSFGKEKLYSITGLPVHAMFSLNKILWIKKHDPELYAATDRFLSVGDYILVQFGLPPYTDHSLASRTMALDVLQQSWSTEILKHCDIPETKLGILRPSGSIAGKLNKSIAESIRLKEGTVVALGGHDQPCCALGSGAIEQNEVCDSAGSYECLTAVSDKFNNTEEALKYSLNSYCHVVTGKFVTLAFFPAGLVTGWYYHQFLSAGNSSNYDEHFDYIKNHLTKPTGICITPHFAGSGTPTWNVNARGVIAGLNPFSTKYELYKAIYEGIACELNINAQIIEKVVGKINRLTITGGNAKQELTIQLRADIIGKTISNLENEEAVCLGAAILAGMATGIYNDAKDGVKKTVRLKTTFQPGKQAGTDYEQQVKRYNSLYPMMEGFW